MSVVGIDFGDESLTVAVARRAGIDVLQNEIGKRKTRSMLSFGSVQRFVADEAITQYLSNNANSVVFIKRIIGKMFNDPDIAHEQKFIPAKLVPDATGRVALAVRHLDKDVLVTPEQVVATFLAKLKQVCAHNMDGQKVSDCVIAIPHYFSDAQRRAILDAARMLEKTPVGGLNVLRLVNDITAVAVQYGVRRTLNADEKRVVVFYDIGVASTDVAVATITSTGVKMESMAADSQLGGRDFDELLVEKLAVDIKEKYKLDVHTNTKALLKLRKECSRIKETLSANTKVPYTIEYLMDGKDVTGMVQREEFENLISTHLKDRLVAPLDRALAAAGVTATEVHSIEMLGGGTRVPFVQTLVKEYTGRELSKTCDADESVCWGATMQCAMYSPSFKVKEYDVKDICAYPIRVEWQHDANAPTSGVLPDMEFSESINVFPANNVTPSVKIVTVKKPVFPLQVAARYSDDSNRPKGQALVARFAIMAPANADMAAKVADPSTKLKLKMKVDANGLLSVVSAHAHYEVDVEVEEPVDASEAAAPAAGEGEKPAESPAAAADASPSPAADGAAAPAEGDAAAAAAPVDGAAGAPATDAEAPAPAAAAPTTRKVIKKVVEKVELGVHAHYPWNLSAAAFTAALEQEQAMAHQDREVRETAERMNELEGFILTMKSRIQDSSDLKPFFAPGKADAAYEEFKTQETWLEDEGYDEKKSVYEAKIEALRVLVASALALQKEAQERPEAIAAVTTALEQWREWTKTTEEKYAHISPELRSKVTAKCDEVALWVANKQNEQGSKPAHEQPAALVKDFHAKINELNTACNVILKTPKPKPAPKPEAPKEEAPKEEAPKEEAKPAEDAAEAAKTEGDKEAAAAEEKPAEDMKDDVESAKAEEAQAETEAEKTEEPKVEEPAPMKDE